MVWAWGRFEEAFVGVIGRRKTRDQIGPHLVTRLPDHRPDRGHDAPAVGAAAFHRIERCLDHAGERATPAGMGRADDACAVVDEEDRAAIGGRDADGQPGNFGNDCIGPRARIRAPRPLDGHDVRRMNLVGGEQVKRCDAERRRHAGAVFGDIARRVMRAHAGVERRIESIGHAACAREEAMADAGKC